MWECSTQNKPTMKTNSTWTKNYLALPRCRPQLKKTTYTSSMIIHRDFFYCKRRDFLAQIAYLDSHSSGYVFFPNLGYFSCCI